MKLQLAKPATWQRYTLLLLLPLGLWLAIEVVARLGAEILWFQEVGYLSVYLSRLFAQAGLWVVTFAIAVLYLLGNLALAQQLKHPDPPPAKKVALFAPSSEIDPDRLKYSMPLRGRWLISLGLGLSLIVGLLLLHYVQVAVAQVFLPSNLANISPLAPLPLRLGAIWQLIQQLVSTRWLGIAFLGGAIALLIYPRFLLTAISLAISAAISTAISRQWTRILPYFQPTQFGNDDPVFGLDISFYIFSLPVWQLLEFALVSLFLYGFVAVALTYLLSANSLSQGLFPGWSRRQQRHLYGLGGCLMLGVAFSYWVSRYELLYSPRGVSYGASYTDINVQLPAYTLLAILAVAIAAYLLWRSLLWPRQISNRPFARKSLGFGLGLYLVMAVVAGAIAPLAVQSLVVQPNELENERPYIERTIAMTRQAFGLEEIEVKPFDPQNRLTYADIQANDLTIRNIRLWDRQPLLDTNRQLQQIRPYYRFADADIDRYTLVSEPQKPPAKQQVLIAARELDYSAVPKQAQTWVNRSLIYTHGYGFTLSPVNKFDASGLPEYFVKDIGITEGTPLTTSSESIRNRIPIGQPRIYYGELTNTYVMTNTKVKELDYPSGADNAYNTYDGRGGINIGSLWQRWMFAKYLNDWRMVFTKDLLPQSKLLFRRNINRRMRAIAPFLQFDSDPYLVAADAQIDQNNQNTNDPSYLYWIVDAYTTSDRYPYADVGNEGINYIRNSILTPSAQIVEGYKNEMQSFQGLLNDDQINAIILFMKSISIHAPQPPAAGSHRRAHATTCHRRPSRFGGGSRSRSRARRCRRRGHRARRWYLRLGTTRQAGGMARWRAGECCRLFTSV
ncbi:MAG: COG1615 family transporter [Pseudanabaena sp. RU_4_16]|nr:COG1615 family transporter [Pseudanabaena sp. RU_4_16]